MIRIPVDPLGKPEQPVQDPPEGPVLLFGSRLLAPPAAVGLLQTVRTLDRQVILITDRLQESTPGALAALAKHGMIAVEVPLPSADSRRLDALADEREVLKTAVAASHACYRADLPIWVRVPLGEHNRGELQAVGHLLTRELMAVARVIFHCLPSLGKPAPREKLRSHSHSRSHTASPPDPMTNFSEQLYSLALELESARIWTAVEHRDGFPLCLFHDEPEPLRFFRGLPGIRAATPSDKTWAYPLEAPADRLVKPDACLRCGLEPHCQGVHRNLVRLRGLSVPQPFAESEPEQTLCKPTDTIYHGAPRRLRGQGAYERFWPPRQDKDDPLPRRRLAISPESVVAAGLDKVRLHGARVILARLPSLDPAEEHVTPSLALNNLVPILREAGADVVPVDLHVRARRDKKLCALLDLEPFRRTDRDLEMPTLSPEAEPRLRQLAEGLLSGVGGQADLLGLSVEVPSTVPLAEAMAAAWKRQGGGLVVAGGNNLARPTELLERCREMDFAVHGEGEIPLLLLVDALRGGRPLEEVPGLAYRDAHGKVVTTHAVVHDLDIHPVPDVSGLDLDAYDGVIELGSQDPVFLYQFIRGCQHSCAFCGEFERWRFRAREPDLVVRDLRFITRQLGRQRVLFVNNMINVTRRYLEAWLDAMEEARLELQWSDCCRPAGIHEAQLRRLAGVGCRSLTWGLDILSAPLNKRLWKNLSLDRAADLLAAAHAAGIKNSVNVIVGLPTETEADVQATIDYLLRHAALFDGVSVMAYNFRKNSPLGMWPARFGLLPTRDGLSEPDGRTWTQLRQIAEEKAERVKEAIRSAIRTR